MADITISKINESWMRVLCKEQYMEMELSERFSFMIPNAKNDPRVRKGHWDGIKRLYNRTHKRMPLGLLVSLIKFIKKQGYSYTLEKGMTPSSSISMDDIKTIIKEVVQPYDKGAPIEPYDYQYEAVHWQLNTGRSICLAATSAGKSLCFYLTIRLYQMLDEMEGKRIFLIVPSKMLVEQMYNDFVNYSSNGLDNWTASVHCQKVDGDYSKNLKKQIIITTWQSLKDIPRYVIQEAGAIFVDEVHTANGPVLTKLLEDALSCPIRHGMTGTLDGVELHELSVQGLFGPIKRIVSAKELIEAGRATEINVNVLILDYDRDTKRRYSESVRQNKLLKANQKYNAEIDYINQLECRKRFIFNMISKLKGNTIVLFDRVEGYGIPLYEEYKKNKDNVFLITGGVDTEDRDEIKTMLENITGGIVFATSNIMSTGVSIKNLHNVVILGSSKSKIKNLQTIGRLMRLHESKSKAYLFDVVDKLDYNSISNYTLEHVMERVKQYTQEGHPIKVKTFEVVERFGTAASLI